MNISHGDVRTRSFRLIGMKGFIVKKDYQAIAFQILEYVGGENNIISLEHCSTRLRFKIKNMSKVERSQLEAVESVVGVRDQDGGIQVVVGQDVDEVYTSIMDRATFSADTRDGVGAQAGESKNLVLRFMNTLADCFVPLIPILIAAGLMSAIISIIDMFQVLDPKSTTYQILDFMGDAPLYFIPFMLAETASKRFKANTFITMGVAATLLYPNLAALMGNAETISFFGLPITVCSYTQSVIPIVLVAFVQHYVEKLFKRIIPKMVATFLEPLFTYFVLAVLALALLGPVATWVSDLFALALNATVNGSFKWLVCGVLGVIQIPLISTGLHYSLMPIVIANFTMNGYDSFWGATCFCSNLALAGSVLALAVASKQRDVKEIAGSTGVTALLGITEPAIYGVAFPHKMVLVSTCIAGGVGALLSGILGVNSYGMAPAGLTSLAVLAGPTFASAILSIAMSFIIGFVLSFVFEKNLLRKKTA